MIIQNIRSAFGSIAGAKLRSFLTVLGIVIGVFAVLVMIGIGDGVKAQVGGQISSLGTNVLTITSGKIGQSTSTARNGQQQRSSAAGPSFGSSLGAPTLTETDVKTASKTADVDKTTSVTLISSNVTRNDLSSNTAYIFGTTPDYFSIRDIKLGSGSFFTSQDDANKAYVVVIGDDTKQNLFGSEDPIGKTVGIRGKQFKVIGVQKRTEGSDTGLGVGEDIVYMPSTVAQELSGSNQVFRILVQVNDPKNIDSVKQSLEQSIKVNHNGSDDFSVLTQEELLSTFNSILDILSSFVIAIAAISLLVGGIGIMNIMLVTVSERTREIGIRKAVGATFWNILGQFMTEAIVLSLVGGLLGLGLAYLAGLLIKKFANITPVYSTKSFLLAIGVSLFVGIVFGVAPAIKAARKRPIQALKAL